MLEVEQKYPVDNHDAIEKRIAEFGVVWTEAIVQVDRYFNHPGRDFAKTDEALRIRQMGDSNYVTYKGPKRDIATKTRHEIELPLAGGRAVADQMAELLIAVGFTPVADVRKHRRAATLGWENHQIELALDNVDELGTFVELEIQAAEDNVLRAQACLESLAKRLDLKASERRSYLELLMQKRVSG